MSEAREWFTPEVLSGLAGEKRPWYEELLRRLFTWSVRRRIRRVQRRADR